METRNLVSKILVTVAVLCLVAVLIISIGYRDELKGGSVGSDPTSIQPTTGAQIQYEQVNLQDMLDELDANAMRAEEKYQDKYIEITGKIRSFDSDGEYISIVPCEASDWSINTVKCNLTDPTHKDFLIEKNVGDVVTIRGKVFSIGEVLGYSVKIAEISD